MPKNDWHDYSKDFLASKATWLAEKGYVAAPVNYRLNEEAEFPAAIHDIKAAVRFLRANADKYHINPQLRAAWEPNASDVSVSLFMATTVNNKWLEGEEEDYLGYDSHASAVVSWLFPSNNSHIYIRSEYEQKHSFLPDFSLDKNWNRHLSYPKFTRLTGHLSPDDAALLIQASRHSSEKVARFYEVAQPILGNRVQHGGLEGGDSDEAFSYLDNLQRVLDFFR